MANQSEAQKKRSSASERSDGAAVASGRAGAAAGAERKEGGAAKAVEPEAAGASADEVRAPAEGAPAQPEGDAATLQQPAGADEDASRTASPEGEGAADDSALASAEASAKVEALRAEVDGLRQQLLRVHADFDNFRRRTRQEREELQQFAARKLLEELLPVVDNFERALASAADDPGSGLKEGIEMVHRQLLGVLERNGVQPMETVGHPFDPNVHQAVMQAPAEEQPPGIVLEELQRGYLLHGKVLRPAMVKVSV